MQFIPTIIIIALLVFGGAYFSLKGNKSNSLNNVPINTSIPSVNEGKVLDLSRKNLDKVPSYVFSRIDVETLDLSYNNLEGALQAEVNKLKNLKSLNLSNNRFSGVPAEIGQLTNLESLDLSNNMITGLPYELGNLSKLKFLDLSGNQYSEKDLSLIKEKLPRSVIIKTK